MNAKPAWPNKESDVHAIYSRVFLLVGAGWGEGAAAWSHVGPEAVEGHELVAKWQALECVPDAVWLTCAGWGAATRGESDARNYAAGGSQVDVAMPYSDEFFGTIEALVDAGEAAFGYRFDYDYVSSYSCVYVLYRALRARYDNEAVDAAGLAAELADADGYAQLRANLARLEALETVFGPVGFDEMQRNAGRNPGAVQPLPAADGGFALRCVGPIEAAETQYVYPAPAALPCPLNSFANASGACFLCDNECTRCPVWKSNSELGYPNQTSELSISAKSTSIRLIFGRIDCSRGVLEARQKILRRNGRIRSH